MNTTAVRLSANSPHLVQWLAHLQYLDRCRPVPIGICPVDSVRSLRFAPPGLTAEDWIVPGEDIAAGVLRLLLPAEGSPTMPVLALSAHDSGSRDAVWEELHALVRRRAAECRAVPAGSHEVPYEQNTPLDKADLARSLPRGLTWNAHAPIGLRQILEVGALPTTPRLNDAYKMMTWGTVTPRNYLRPCSRLELTANEPPGATYVEPERLEDTHTAAVERMRRGRGRRAYHAGIIDVKSNTLVGFTSISLTASVPDRAYQGMTAVHEKHRGRGIATLLKLANLQQLITNEPSVREVETTNDETNTAVLALNRSCGFRPVSHMIPWKIADISCGSEKANTAPGRRPQ